jgi:hypothetical protein
MRLRMVLSTALLVVGTLWGAGCRAGAMPAARIATRVAAAAEDVRVTMTAVRQEINVAACGTPIVQPPAEARTAVRLAIEDLVKKTGVRAERVCLLRVETVEWSDASLGCPREGMVYAQVITPGFLVVLGANGREYTYHTDWGRFVTLCDK